MGQANANPAVGIVSKYVYYEEGDAPTKEDIEASERLEGRLREGFVRLRQLLVCLLAVACLSRPN